MPEPAKPGSDLPAGTFSTAPLSPFFPPPFVNCIDLTLFGWMVIICGERRSGLPTYDYRCIKCGREFSAEQSMLEKPLRKCRKCGGRLEKLLPRNLNLIFKGSGFYSTDYRKPEPKPEGSDKAKRETRSEGVREGKEAQKAKKEKDANS